MKARLRRKDRKKRGALTSFVNVESESAAAAAASWLDLLLFGWSRGSLGDGISSNGSCFFEGL